ncbi:unnamed protein product [Lymnaea stagnalis]|uniref:CW-type domain-containing protein n=1 Tax=Lymnaea stagnalis TaxID=6523 RepID=A0AAV2HU93_LYMST
MQLSVTLQCDMCLKWRMIPFNSNNIGKEFPDHWVCTMNPDQQHSKCSSAEQKLNIPEGVLKKEFKSQEQKKKDLEEEILRKTEMLEKLQKMKVVPTSKDVDFVLKKEEKQASEGRASLSRKAKARSPSPPKSPSPEPPSRSRSSGSQASVPVKKLKRSPSPSPRRAVSKPPAKLPTTQVTTKPTSKPKRRSPSPPPKRAAVKVTKPVVKPESRKRVQRVAESSEEEELDEVEEEEEEESKSKRRKTQNNIEESETKEMKRSRAKDQVIEYPEIPVKKQRISHLNTELKPPKPAEMPNTDSESSSRSTRSRGKSTNPKSESSADESEAQTTETVDIKDMNGESFTGTRVEAHINNKWYPGTVVEMSADGKWKVKFDHHPKDKYDKWYDKSGPEIKLLDKKKDSNTVPSSPSSQDGAEAPTSSTTTPAVTSQATEDIANGYRTCLRYFLPPQWIMDKDAITAMSLQELSDFPLDDFFDHYERGLRRLVSNFQTEASMRKQESEEAKSKLVAVRKLIAKLLKSTNEDFDIDPEESGDQVDELLAACVRQATSQTS